MNGTIFNIQHGCYNDGPGVRTTVFLKGCPLNCLWCHNPESKEIKQEMMFNSDRCSNCLRCVGACPQNCHTVFENKHCYDKTNCLACGKCMEIYCGNLEKVGRDVTTDEVLDDVIKDKPFYDASGGGLTLSGGEPLYQSAFALELMQKAKNKDIHICIETCGFVSQEILKKSAEFVDIYLFDYKVTDPQKHKKFTGVDNKSILENLKMLDSMNKTIILRCPIIPNYNDDDEHFMGIAKLAEKLQNIKKIEIEPYHSSGSPKYRKLGVAYCLNDIQNPDEKTIEKWIEKIQKNTKVSVDIA